MTDQPQEPTEKRIFVDEDWKSKVQAEKEQAEQPRPDPNVSQDNASQDIGQGPLPPPSLTLMATTLGMQAMVALGLVPDPVTSKTEVRLAQARHMIDTVQMLQDKTQGNRSPEESSILDSLLHDLRMAYVTVAQQSQPTPDA